MVFRSRYGRFCARRRLIVGFKSTSKDRAQAQTCRSLTFFERSLHVLLVDDLVVTPDRRSHGKGTATIFGGALVLMSINRQVRLGDFLFTGE
ncbi:MAG TPA: hypothetical protein DIT33_01345 [Pseudomonas sp.]|nr:hypothetical protein TU85_10330 [Pseudomonas helleri]HCN62027.1 hypothetical protein [Pseudomonas sp.]